ncbi:hypothetical protein [Desulfovibrio sp.]|uniref:hypothetical protein n=1 Tax=Desulfovibrio sp. TaxID=885 RepID=UPI0025C5B24F|nr:hypothetical protein [Desulfovibrio sp.]
MTMPYSPSRAIYEGNNAATSFPFFFRVWTAAQLVVTLTSPEGVTSEASGWTADLGAAGGEITYLHQNAPLPNGWKLAITRNMPFTQEVNLVSASRFDPQVIEDALDQATAERQQTLEMMRRSVILPATSSETPQDVVQNIFAARDHCQAARNAAQAAMNTAGQRAEAAEKSAAQATGQADRAKTEADRAQNLANIGPATTDTLGMVKTGEGIAVETDGTISVTPVNLATSEASGTVRPGTGMTVDDGGALHIAYWDAFPPYVPIPIWGVTFGGSDGRRAIMPGETAAREDWLLCDGGNDGKGGVVPNLMGRVLLGAESNDQEGTLGGSTSHTHTVSGATSQTTLSIGQIPHHGHSYTSYNSTNSYGYYSSSSGAYSNTTTASTGGNGGNGAHAHDLSTVSVTAASNYMPFCAAIFVMKTI